MIAANAFRPWVPDFLRIPILIFLYFVALNFNGVYQGNTTDIFSDLGIYAETYTAAFNAVYIGMGLGFLIHMRLAARFSSKALILYGFTVQLLMNAVCAVCAYPLFTIAGCLILGVGKAAVVKELFSIWGAIWSKEGDRSKIYPSVFSLALAGSFLLFWVMTKLAFLYSWQYAYVPLIAGSLTAILLVHLLFDNHPLQRVLPLYQMDGIGIVLLLTVMLLINYISVYGQVEDWLNSAGIRLALFALPVVVVCFLLREGAVRRPVLPLTLFKIRDYKWGLLLLMTTGLYFPATLQLFYTQDVLKFEVARAEELNLYLIPGVVAGAVLSALWYRLKWPPLLLICIGMICCLIYNGMLYHQLTGTEGLQDFRLPGLFKGAGICMLYIALGIFTLITVPPAYGITALGFLIMVRSFLARGIFTSAFGFLLYTGRVRHLSTIAASLDPGWHYRWKGGAASGGYRRFMLRQAYLGAEKELTGGIVLVGGVIVLVLIAGYVTILRKPEKTAAC